LHALLSNLPTSGAQSNNRITRFNPVPDIKTA